MNNLKLFIGTGFGVGNIPFAPGTFGSLTSLIFIYLFLAHELYLLLPVMIILFSLLTLWVSPVFEEQRGKDHGSLVTDEWAGQFVTFLSISFTGLPTTDISILLGGFFLFRLFDIWKPLGINRLQTLPGGWGVLVDDLLAGLYALICLKLLIFVSLNI